MSSDIQLGDDESLTLACAELRTRNTVADAEPVGLSGKLRILDRVYLAVPPAGPAAVDRSRGTVAPTQTQRAPALWGGKLVAAGELGVGEYTGGQVYDPVYQRLKNRPVPVDLWEELQMLRSAVIDLHARLKKAGL